MDISGVAVVDSAVANHLIKITKATQLMGCESLVSGLSPAIAQTIVHLGIDTEQISTFATLRDALEEAFRNCGLRYASLDEEGHMSDDAAEARITLSQIGDACSPACRRSCGRLWCGRCRAGCWSASAARRCAG